MAITVISGKFWDTSSVWFWNKISGVPVLNPCAYAESMWFTEQGYVIIERVKFSTSWNPWKAKGWFETSDVLTIVLQFINLQKHVKITSFSLDLKTWKEINKYQLLWGSMQKTKRQRNSVGLLALTATRWKKW